MLNFDEIRDGIRDSLGYAITESIRGTIMLDSGGVNPYRDLGYFVPVRLNNTPERVAVAFDPSINENILVDDMPVLVRRTPEGYKLEGIDIAAASSLLGGQMIKISAAQIGLFGGASSSTNGRAGLVPAPAAGQEGRFLRGNGQWSETLLSLTSGVSWYTVSTTAGAATLNAVGSQTAYRVLGTSTSASALGLRLLNTRYMPDCGATEHRAWTTFTSSAFQSITTGALGTDEMEIWMQLRSEATATSDGLLLRFNADTTAANYVSLSSNTTHADTLTTTENLSGVSQGIVIANGMTAANSPANWFSFLKVKVCGYNVSARTKLVSWEGFTPADDATGELIKVAGGGMWLNTSSAITSWQLYTTSGSNFAGATQYIGVGNAN